MARPLRIKYVDAWYHVMNRGAGRREIFPDDPLRHGFLNLLGDIYEMFDVHCHAYCLMPNHYHLLLQTLRPNIDRAMRHLDGVYAQRHNRRLETDGPLFRGRYAARLIEDGDYLWTVSRYIHRNPVEAGLVREAVAYPWSSFRFYADARGAPRWLCKDRTLQQFGGPHGYRNFVEKDSDADLASDLSHEIEAVGCQAVLGSDDFVSEVMSTVEADREIPLSRRSVAPSVAALVDACCAGCNIARRDLLQPGRHEHRVQRALVMTALRDFAGAALRDIGTEFGMTYSAAGMAIQRCRRRVRVDPGLAVQLARLRAIVRKMCNVET